MLFSSMLDGIMEHSNVSAYKVAKDTGIPDRTIGLWRSGKTEPTIGNLIKLCDYFGVSADFLLGLDPPDYATPDQMKLIRLYESATPDDRAAIDLILKKYRQE